MAQQGTHTGFARKLIFVAVAACFVASAALANPTGPAVVNGTATIQQTGNLLQITNSPNAIINWQSFSIGASEITRFLQQSASSAVLNRIISQNPSAILGALQSNGRVFLINPNGILFGAGAQIDVAGLIVSTLNLANADFLAGRLRFTDVPGAGSIVNQGNITTGSGGQVYLVGPAVTNSGIITSPKGEVILAAGNSVELVNPGTPNLRVEITAPDNQAINLGQIIADSGRVGIYAGLINHSGTIRADSAVATDDGRIVLKATESVTLEPTSVISASGTKGGEISVLAGSTVQVAGRLDASAPNGGDGGFIETSAANVRIDPAAVITTAAPYGKTGTWLIDPEDFVIALQGGDMTGAFLGAQLGTNNVIITSDTVGPTPVPDPNGTGSIFVNDTVSWSSNNSLTLTALGDVNVNSSITNTGTGAVALYAGWDGTSPAATPVVTPGVGDVNVGSAAATVPAVVSTGGMMTVTAGDTLAVQGGSASGAFARLTSGGGQAITAANITLIGGSGDSAQADILQTGAGANQVITLTASTLSLQGGSVGANNFARIRNEGTSQQINFSGPGGVMTLTGGTGTSDDFARVQALTGTQSITGRPAITLNGGITGGLADQGNFAQIRAEAGMQSIVAGSTSLIAGAAGVNNSANISAPSQNIDVLGDLVLTGGGSAASLIRGGGARIGGLGGDTPGPTNLALTVNGNVNMTGGSAANSGATIGSGFGGGQTTDITMNVTGNVTLNPGTVSGSRIGSPALNVAGGDIYVSAGGDIALNGVSGVSSAIRTAGDITLQAATGNLLDLQSGTSVNGGNVFLKADNMNIAGTVTGGPFTTILPFTSKRGIDLGSGCSSGCLALSLDNTELNNILGGGIIIGDAFGGSGALTFTAPVGPTSSFLNIRGTSITQNSGAAITGGLHVIAPGGVTLNEAGNRIDSLNGFNSGPIKLVTSVPLTVGQIGTNNANVNLQSSGNISLQASGVVLLIGAGTGTVTLNSTGGAIVDNHPGMDILASLANLMAASGIGSIADPLETQVGTIDLMSTGSEIGIVNTGNLLLNSLNFSGAAATVSAMSTLTVPTTINVPGSSLTLSASNDLDINANVTAGSVLTLSGGSHVRANNAVASATGTVNINNTSFLDIIAGSSPSQLRAGTNLNVSVGEIMLQGGSAMGASAELRGGSGMVNITTTAGGGNTGNVFINGGSGDGSFARIFGDPDVNMTVGGMIVMNAGIGSGAFARVESASANSIQVTFPNLTSGGYSVNGQIVESIAPSGFFAGGSAATLGQNLLVTYCGSGTCTGGATLPPPPPPLEPPPNVIDEVVVAANQVVVATDQIAGILAADQLKGDQAGAGVPEDKKKELPVCR